MNLKYLTDQQLLADTKVAVAHEREATVAVLEHIREVQRRRLFTELGYSSLFKYLVSELAYSEGQAYRRIAAARLVEQLPALKSNIASGELNLTNASKLQGFFSEKKLPVMEQLALAEQVKYKTTRECEQILNLAKDPAQVPTVALNLKLNEAQMIQWQKLRALVANRGWTQEELFAQLVEQGLMHWDPVRKSGKKKSYKVAKDCEEKSKHASNEVVVAQTEHISLTNTANEIGNIYKPNHKTENKQQAYKDHKEHKDESDQKGPEAEKAPKDKKDSKNHKTQQQIQPIPIKTYSNKNSNQNKMVAASQSRSSIPMSVKRALWQRSQGHCEWQGERGLRCQSRWALQIDHIQPWSLSGADTLSNLQVLCRQHHQRKTLRDFGVRTGAS